MKLFGRKGKSVRIEVILAIIVLLMILCMGFGYCLRFVHREGMLDEDLDEFFRNIKDLPPKEQEKQLKRRGFVYNNGFWKFPPGEMTNNLPFVDDDFLSLVNDPNSGMYHGNWNNEDSELMIEKINQKNNSNFKETKALEEEKQS